MDVKLGSRYRDKTHGLEGVATALAQYMTGCNQVRLEFVKDGEIKSYWFDEPNVELVKEEQAAPPVAEKDRGGPRGVPPNRHP